MYLDIQGLEWEFNAGNSTDLMPNDTTTLGATLDPFFDYIGLPYDSMAIIVSAYNATWNYTAGRYMFDTWPDGNLIVTLADGSRTVIPSDDLFDWPRQYDDRGYLGFTPDMYYTPKIMETSYYTAGSYLWFGQPFLTQKVIVADFDNGKYHIADAVKQDLGTTASNVKPLCTGGPASTSPPPLPPPPVVKKKSTNVAAIAGGVAGGVGGFLIVALIAFFVLRRRKQKKVQQQVPYLAEVTQIQSEPSYRGSTMSPPPKYMTGRAYETGSDSQQQQRYQSPPPQPTQFNLAGSEIASPKSDSGTISQWGGSDKKMSQAGVSGNDSKYEMSSDNRFTATSGPIEMPSAYGHDDHTYGQPEHYR